MKKVLCVLTALVAMSGSVLAQTTVKVHGATTLEKIVKGKLADIEAKAGVKIELVGNGAGRGLEDLASGTADIAMIAGPLTVLSEVVNEKKPDLVKPAELKEEVLFTLPAAIIAHTGVTTESLTADQLKGLLTGTIKNWKDVGGADLAVVVVAAVPSDGVRAAMQASLLKTEKFAADARVMQTAPDVIKVVAQVPGALSVVSSKHANETVKVIKTDAAMDVPFALVTKLDAKDPLPAVVAAIKELAKP